MQLSKKILFFIKIPWWLCFLGYFSFGQSIQIESIQFKGNDKTRASILSRELDISEKDSIEIESIDKRLEFNRRKLMNTNLFIWVKVDYHQTNNGKLEISFEFLEQWYILAYPVFQLAERNLTDWWTRGHNFDRVVYGAHFTHNNFRGMSEKIQIRAESGFTERLDFNYTNPYTDIKKTLGIALNLNYQTTKSLAYISKHDTLKFIQANNNMREKWSGGISLRKRFKFYDFQTIELKYNHSILADTILKLNPKYLQGKTNEQNYFQMGYQFSYDFRDFVAYPLRGKKIDIGFIKYGLFKQDEVSYWEILGAAAYFFDLKNKFFLTNQVKIKYTQEDQTIPYSNVRGLGYGNELVRGYELNVIDGDSYFLSRNTLKFELFSKILPIKFIPWKQFNQLPLSIYPTAFFDFAYVNQPKTMNYNSSLANKWIYGYGLGFDIVTYYNIVCKISFPVINGNKSGFVVNLGREF
ncbi:BamA/TamA family outer membrane protein [Aquirufa sp. ROCK-SH2]